MSILRFSLFTILLISCSQYRAFQKVSKSTDPDFQYEKAVYYYISNKFIFEKGIEPLTFAV